MRMRHMLVGAAALLMIARCQAQEEWQLLMGSHELGPVSDQAVLIGVSPDASDNHDSQDRLKPDAFTVMNVWIHHSTAEGWLGPEGFYEVDIRAPVETRKTWDNIYLWWWPGTTRENYPVLLDPSPWSPPPAYYSFTLYLDQVPAGAAYTGPWQWELSPTGTTEIPAGTFTPFESETGLDGYRFHLMVVVPEPGSLVALAGALVLVGVRRRLR